MKFKIKEFLILLYAREFRPCAYGNWLIFALEVCNFIIWARRFKVIEIRAVR
jgi:hypothetical protein